MNRNRTSWSPRLILDESMTIGSLQILSRHGLNQRCAGVFQSWRAEKTHNDQLMKQRESDATATGKTQLGAALGRIQNGFMKWLVEQAVAQYPCVCRSRIHAKTDDSLQILNRGSYYREYPRGFI